MPPQVSLVIYHRGEADIVPLVPRARIVIGRANEADLCVPEPTLSRQHALVEVIGNDVWIEDLGSTDGTWVNGQPVQRAKLHPGDDATLGMVTLSLHTTGSYARGVEHHARFVAVLEEEVTRARTFGHQLAVIMLAPLRPGEQHLFDAWCPRVRQLLRPVDRAALHAPGTLELLLPETGLAEAQQVCERIAAAAPALRRAIAVFPGCAPSAAGLLEACRAALARADARAAVICDGAEQQASPQGAPPLLSTWGEAMRPVHETVLRVARSDLPVLIVGETGSGKEVVARAIHEAGPRRQLPIHCCNCGALPRELVASILLGHERGAFTGAAAQQRGVFESAHRSTLLLDEVGELSPEAQVALLRVLETGRVLRVGGSREVEVDVRVLSATNSNLQAMCEAGTFRWDLFYRLNAITVKVPPLRQRTDEIVPLAEHFIAQACRMSGLPPRRLDPPTAAVLQRYQWRGNVRELRNAMERAVLVAAGEVIVVNDLPDLIRAAVKAPAHEITRNGRPHVEVLGEPGGFKNKVRCFEIRLIRRALERTGWNRTTAAQQLQIPLRTLMHKIQGYGLAPGPPPTDDTLPVLEAISDEDQHPRPFKTRIREYETELLVGALNAVQWNRADAARRLRIPLSTLLYKLKAYELEQPAETLQ